MHIFSIVLIPATEDGDSSRSTNLEALGTIEARLYRTTLVGIWNPPAFVPREVENVGSVNERSKKAGGHCVT